MSLAPHPWCRALAKEFDKHIRRKRVTESIRIRNRNNIVLERSVAAKAAGV
jgi:hypothetical protein